MNVVVHTRPSQELISGSATSLPPHIQWMPPGLQQVQPMGFAAPFPMTVSAALAAEANQQLQQLRSEAAAGRKPEPYLDANHKDESRLAKALRLWWGGEHPKTGGIRLDVEWTGAGARVCAMGNCLISPRAGC